MPPDLKSGTCFDSCRQASLSHSPRSRSMPSIGARCHELRVQDETVTWRLVYRIDPKGIRPGDMTMEAKQRKNLAKMGG